VRPDVRERIAAQRLQRIEAGRLRRRICVTRREGVRIEIDGRWRIDFASNDYLGLAQHPAVIDALNHAAAREGVGGRASHLVNGHHTLHDALEREIADWLQVPSALLLGSGYLANLAVVQSFLSAGDICVQDRLNHASLIDGARLSGCQLRRYPHADAEGARRQLLASPNGAALIATDGVFSMDGDIAPLSALAAVARDARALLYVDDAHGIGVLGPDGRGSAAAAGLTGIPLQLVTLGKALGGYGAVLVGETALTQHLAETARPYIYTTALPPSLAAATLTAVKLARSEHWRREQLQTLIAYFAERCQIHGLHRLPSSTPIQPILIGDNQHTLNIAERLSQAGFQAGAIRPPTVPEGQARLRITVSALHDKSQIDALVDALASARDAVLL